MTLKIYLAGPDVFLPDAHRVGEQKRGLCREFGFEGLFPLDNDHDIGAGAAKVFQANCSLMRQADIGLLNLTPFRGPSADAGTVFELGFLFASGKPVYGYTSAISAYRDRVADVQGSLVERDGRLRERGGYAVENFGLGDNLMIVCAVEASGSLIAVPEETMDDQNGGSLAAFSAFKACLAMLRERIGGGDIQ